MSQSMRHGAKPGANLLTPNLNKIFAALNLSAWHCLLLVLVDKENDTFTYFNSRKSPNCSCSTRLLYRVCAIACPIHYLLGGSTELIMRCNIIRGI
jgi:hypothetical protein